MTKAKKEKKVDLEQERLDRLERLKVVQNFIKQKHDKDDSGLALVGNEVRKVATDSSGSACLDKALGGGYARGRIIEIYGQEASGKTTLTLHAIAEQQKAGKLCAFIDVEQALDIEYARRIGVKVDELLIIQPEYGEQAGQIALDLANTGEVGCIVVDSVAAMVPRKEIEGELESNNAMGLMARNMSKLMRAITPVAAKNKVTVFFINQLREKIGVMFGDPKTTTGGNALKFYASQRLYMLTGTKVKDPTTGELLGGTLKVRVAKNKITAPGNTTEIPVRAGVGVDRVLDVVELAKQVFKGVKSEEDGPVRFAGAHHYFYGQHLDSGEELPGGKYAASGKEAGEVLKANPKLLEKLRETTMATLAGQKEKLLSEL